MPFYSYRCTNCHADFDVMRSFSERKETEPCPECGMAASATITIPSVARVGRGGTGAGRRAT